MSEKLIERKSIFADCSSGFLLFEMLLYVCLQLPMNSEH